MTYEEEICQRLRGNAHTERALANGVQASLDYAELLERAANLIEAQDRTIKRYDRVVERSIEALRRDDPGYDPS